MSTRYLGQRLAFPSRSPSPPPSRSRSGTAEAAAVQVGSFDRLLFAIIVALVPFGLLMVYSASFVDAIVTRDGQPAYYMLRQVIGTVLGVIVFFVALRIPYHFWQRFALPLTVLVLAVLVALVALPASITQVNGARSWVRVGPLSIQPSEFAKFVMLVYFAHWLSKRGSRVADVTYGLVPFSVMLGVVCGLIMMQPDLGTTIVMVVIAGVVYFAAGANLLHILGALGLAGAAFWGMVNLAAYRIQRIAAWQDPFAHYDGAGYQPVHALFALSRGGLFGVGLGQSREKFLWLPQAHTDTIAAIIGEEFGLLGLLVVIGAFACIAWRGFRIAAHAPDSFSRLLAIGITGWLVFQAIINLGVVVGLLPFTGLTLPFLSYGSSSLIACMLGAGVLLNISRYSRKQ
jgi:cell division protein FtsW